MFQSAEIIFYILFLLVYFYVSTRQILKISVFKSQQVLILLHVLAFGVIAIDLGFLWLEKLDVFLYEKILKGCLGLAFGIYLTELSLMAISRDFSRRTKTLWRVPIIGLLAVSYFEYEYSKLILIGYIVIMFFILLKQKEHLRYLRVSVYPFLILIIFTYFLNPLSLGMVSIFAACCLLISRSLLELANINGLIRSKVSEE